MQQGKLTYFPTRNFKFWAQRNGRTNCDIQHNGGHPIAQAASH